jgi:hypothetical protein
MKAGTTALHRLLSRHPDIQMSVPKELNFFSHDDRFARGEGWYFSNFASDARVVGESSPHYTMVHGHPHAASRLAAMLPKTRLIYVVREPLQRIRSHYVHKLVNGSERRSIAEALMDLDGNHYIETSRYMRQLEPYLACGMEERILVLRSDDLEGAQRATMARVYAFLELEDEPDGLPEVRAHRSSAKVLYPRPVRRLLTERLPARLRSKTERASQRVLGRSIDPPVIPDDTAERIRSHLAPDLAALSAWTGLDLSAWNRA